MVYFMLLKLERLCKLFLYELRVNHCLNGRIINLGSLSVFVINPDESFFLIYLILLPIIGIIFVLFIPSEKVRLIKLVTSLFSIVSLFFSIVIYCNYNFLNGSIQFYKRFDILSSFNFGYVVGVDSISINLIVLTTFLIFISIFSAWDIIKYRVKEFYILMLLLEFVFINIFCLLDIFLFYIFFELVLVPMFMLIGIWGSRDRKIHAVYQFFFYTLIGSLIMLLGILILYYEVGSTDFYQIISYDFSNRLQVILWFCFFCSIAVKVPIVPLHIWLPEAHVEAPTSGSIILAGIVLKLGVYALLRYSIPIFPYGTIYFSPLVITVSIISIFYASLSTIRQVDMKKVIAYSSVAHMNFALVGVMSCNIYGLSGGMYLMLGHGVISSGLFFVIGVLYDRYGSRLINYYGGLVVGMPIFSVIFLLLTLANIGFPGFMNFIGEINILIGIYYYNIYAAFLSMFGIIFSAVYSILLYNRVVFGIFKQKNIFKFSDLNRREFFCLFMLIIVAIYFGVYPSIPLLLIYQDILMVFEVFGG